LIVSGALSVAMVSAAPGVARVRMRHRPVPVRWLKPITFVVDRFPALFSIEELCPG